MAITNYDGQLEAWATKIETMEQALEALYGAPAITPSLPSPSNYDGMLEAIADETGKAAWSFANIYNTLTTESGTTYTVTVPSTSLYCAELVKVGGNTVVFNQLNNNPGSTSTINGVQYVKKNDGSWVVNGTAAPAGSSKIIGTFTLVSGNKYYVKGCPAMDGCSLGFSEEDTGEGGIYESDSTSGSLRFKVAGDTMVSNVTIYPQFFDLTRMFGSGNEPTVERCREIFSESYYPYNTGELMSAEITEIVSKGTDDIVIDTVDVPAEVQALTGYGWSAGTAYNYIDYANKKFVQCVDSVDLGTLTWSYSTVSGRRYYYSTGIQSLVQPPDTSGDIANAVCDRYETKTFLNVYNGVYTCIAVVGANSGNAGRLAIYDPDIQDLSADDFKTEMSGTIVQYELATPVETSVSTYITDDLIKIEPGGTLTFENANKYDVPSEVKHIGV